MPRIAGVFLLVLCICVPGCFDTMVVSTQEVAVEVSDAGTAEPVAGAVVEVSASRNETPPPDPSVPEQFEPFAYRRRTTDTTGHATLDIDAQRMATYVPGWRDPMLDPGLDMITGTQYLFRISEGGQGEVFYVTMAPTARSEGTRFAVTIDSIGPPRTPYEAEEMAILAAYGEYMRMSSNN